MYYVRIALGQEFRSSVIKQFGLILSGGGGVAVSHVSARCSLRLNLALLRWFTSMAGRLARAIGWGPQFSMGLRMCSHRTAAGLFQSKPPKGARWEPQHLLCPSPRGCILSLSPALIQCGRELPRAWVPGGKSYQGPVWKLATTAAQAGYSL